MTYILNRPAGMLTAVRSKTNVVHRATGWSAYEGIRTACGRRVRGDGGDDAEHMAAFTAENIAQAWAWDTTAPATPCKQCLQKETR